MEKIKNSPMMIRGVDSAKLVKMIVTEAMAGEGTKESPFYTKVQYWTLNGKLVAEIRYPNPLR